MSNVLFDVPGPKARLRYRTYAVVGTIVVLAFLAYIGWRFYDSGQFTARKWEWLQYAQVQRDLASAVLSTLQAFAVAAVLAVIFGAIFAAGRLSDHAWIRGIAGFVVEFFRAIPALILILQLIIGSLTPFAPKTYATSMNDTAEALRPNERRAAARAAPCRATSTSRRARRATRRPTRRSPRGCRAAARR